MKLWDRQAPRGNTRVAIAIVAALVPFVAVGVASRWIATSLATDLATKLDDYAERVRENRDAEGAESPVENEDVPVEAAKQPAKPAKKAPKKAAKKADGKEKTRGIGVLVRRNTVKALVAKGAQPGGHPVPATSYRPAGLALAGVSGLGVGLRDGDVLTSVGGTPARSYGDVVSAVAGALRSGAPAISGEAWRGEQRVFITVELPSLRKAS
jgi:hypothetical protein